MNWKQTLEKGQVSEAVKRLNPHLFVGRLGSTKPQPDKVRALDGKPSSHKSRKRGVAVIVAFVPVLNRETDSDNCGSGPYKAARDSIARTLGVDDADARIKWEYHPAVITKGKPGTQVLITCK